LLVAVIDGGETKGAVRFRRGGGHRLMNHESTGRSWCCSETKQGERIDSSHFIQVMVEFSTCLQRRHSHSSRCFVRARGNRRKGLTSVTS
jgi:hypothetical protein